MKKKIYISPPSPSIVWRVLSCDLFCILYFLHVPLTCCWRWWQRVFLLSRLPTHSDLWTFVIVTKKREEKKKKKFIIMLFKRRWWRGEEKSNVLSYKSHAGCLRWKKKEQRKSICELWHRTTFRNTTIYRIYKQEQHMQMTRHCLAFGLELQRALWRTLSQNKLRVLLKCHGTPLY